MLMGGVIELDVSIDTAPFILAASALVDQVEAASDFTSATLELIETWLAAHFYCIRDPRVVSENAGPVGATYQSNVGLFLSLTHYGQMAMVLDTSGTLKGFNTPATAPKIVSVTWLGTKP